MMLFNKLPKFVDYRTKILKHPYRRYRARSFSSIKTIAIHHSATTSGSPDAFARYHVQTLGWPGIGYHFVIDKSGYIYYCNNLLSVSYNVGNSNGHAAGICLVGYFPKQQPTKEQWDSLYRLVGALMQDLDVPVNKVLGHQEYPGYSWKPCPGLNMNEIRNNLKAKPKETPKPSDQTYYVVRKGDTLWEISKRFDISVDELKKLNPSVDPRDMKVGERILLKREKYSKPNPEYYTVQAGDTLWQIAHNHDNVTLKELRELNPGVEPTNLKVGQKLKLSNDSLLEDVKQAIIPKPHEALKYPGELIKEGSRGREVMQIQQKLGIEMDGIFGPITEAKVKEYQRRHGLGVDGIVGPKTWGHMF